jgi:hypothetical protein
MVILEYSKFELVYRKGSLNYIIIKTVILTDSFTISKVDVTSSLHELLFTYFIRVPNVVYCLTVEV